jgi:gliding motility-associated-like protein
VGPKTVNVLPQPALNLTILPDNNFKTCDTILTKNFTLSPDPGGTIFWTIDGVTYPGSTVNNYKILDNDPIQIDIQVQDANGCANTLSTTRTPSLGYKITGNFSSNDSMGCIRTSLTTTFTPSIQLNGNTLDSVKWEFPGSTTPIVVSTTLTSPVVTYNTSGQYDVTLKVYKNGCEYVIASKTGYMKLGRRPVVDFKIVNPTNNTLVDSITICSGTTLTLKNTTAPTIAGLGGTWMWTIPGSGFTTVSTNDSLRVVQFTDAGQSSVRLRYTSTIGNCVVDTFKPMIIKVLGPRALLNSAVNRAACQAPYTVNFQHSSILPTTGTNTFNWTFYGTDGTTILGTSTQPTPSYTYTANGNYKVSLAVTNSLTGCTSTITSIPNFVQIGPNAPVPNITGTVNSLPSKSGCLSPTNTSLTFTVSAVLTLNGLIPDSLQWYFQGVNDSIRVIGSNVPQTVTYNTPGNYRVRLIVWTRGCSKQVLDDANYFTVINKPVVAFTNPILATIDTITTCVNQPIKFYNTTANKSNLPGGFIWSAPGSTVVNTNSDSIELSYTSTGCFSVQLSYIGACNVDSSKSCVVKVVGPVAVISQRIVNSNCTVPFRVHFKHESDTPSLGTNIYTWSFYNSIGGAPTVSNVDTPSFNYTAFGNYNVMLKVRNTLTGCTSIDSQVSFVKIRNIQIGLNPTPTSTVVTGCAPFQVNTTTLNTTVNQTGYTYTYKLIDQTGNVYLTANGDNASPNPVLQIGKPGVYSLRLIVTDDLGCSDSITRNNYITVRGIDGNIQPSSNYGCLSNSGAGTYTGTFSLSSLISHPLGQNLAYAWSVTPSGANGATITAGTTAATATIQFNKVGFYDIKVTVTYGSGATACTRQLSLLQYPVGTTAAFTIPPAANICLNVPQQINNTSSFNVGSLSKYLWTTIPANAAKFLPDSATSAPQFVPLTNSPFQIQLTLTNDSTCVDTQKVTVTPFKLRGNFSTKDTLVNCSPRVVTFKCNLSNMVKYTWVFLDTVGGVPQTKTVVTQSDSVFKFYNSNGPKSIMLVIENSDGCIDTIIKNWYVKIQGPQPDFVIGNNFGCEPRTVTFQDISSNVSSYNFSYGDGSTSAYNLGSINTKTYNFPNTSNTAIDSFKFNVAFFASDGFCLFTRFDSVVVYPKAKFRFKASDTIGCEPFTVQFTDSSLYAPTATSKFLWDFGDGQTDTLRSPVHIFQNAGTYTIKLRILTPRGCQQDTVWKFKITVNPTPKFRIGVSPKVGCEPLSVTLNDTSQNITTKSMVWGDGTSVPYNLNAVNTKVFNFLSSNPVGQDSVWYKMTLSASNPKCSNTWTDSVLVFAKAKHRFWVDDSTGCTPHLATFSDTSLYAPNGSSYNWTFGNGNTSILRTPAINFPVAGVYSVNLKITNNRGCLADSTWKFRITAFGHPKASFNSNDSIGCYGVPVSFNNTSTPVGSFTSRWDFGDTNSLADTSNLNTPAYVYQGIGTFSPSLIVKDGNGCTDTLKRSNYILIRDTLPPINNGIRYVTVVGNKIKIVWNTTNAPYFSHYSVSKNAGSGYSVIQSSYFIGDTVFVDPAVIPATQPYSYEMDVLDTCNIPSISNTAHRSIFLSVSSTQPGINDLVWTPYQGWNVQSYRIYRSEGASSNFTLLATVNGSVTTYSDLGLCDKVYNYFVEAVKDVAPIYVSASNNISQQPVSAANSNPMVVKTVTVDNTNNSVVLRWEPTPNAAKTFFIDRKVDDGPWQLNFVLLNSSGATAYVDNQVSVSTSSYTYRIKYSDSCGNLNNVSDVGKSILLKGGVNKNAANLTDRKNINLSWTRYEKWASGVLQYDVFIESPTGINTLIGSTTDTFFVDSNTSRFNLASDLFCYSILARNSGGGIEDTSLSNTLCINYESEIFIPTAFTPGPKDELNKSFKIYGLSLANLSILIYDRWGNVVYESSDPSEGWNGQLNNTGNDLPAGVYQVVVQGKGKDRRNFRREQTINLIR